MIQINVDSRKAAATSLEPLPTGNDRTIEVSFVVSGQKWSGALLTAIFKVTTNRGRTYTVPAILDDDGIAKIPDSVLIFPGADVAVGLRGTFADKAVASELAHLGKTVRGADTEDVPDPEKLIKTDFDNFLAELMRIIEQRIPADVASKAWVESQGYLKDASFDDYAKKEWVENKGYLTEQSLDGYVTEDEQTAALAEKQDNIDSEHKLDYSLIANTPEIPTIPTDVSAFNNDVGYQTAGDVETAISGKADSADLGDLAYEDTVNYETQVTNKPTIPAVPTAVSELENDVGYQTESEVADAIDDAVDGKEDSSNKTTSLSSSSTDTEYPSAKCVYDIIGDVENILDELIGGETV